MSAKKLEQNTSSIESKELVLKCVQRAIDKKAEHSLIFDVGSIGAFTQFFLITSGNNERQVQAIVDDLRLLGKEMRGANGLPTIEGYDEGRWVLVDFGDVVAHVFHESIREFYDLEALWSDAPRVKIPENFFSSAVQRDAFVHHP
jgi:ribosome-associated protein